MSSNTSYHTLQEETEEKRCRACNSQSLRIDWAQGDCVCTDCGVVDEAHLRDDRPEWKDFNEAEDIIKGIPSSARCGFVVPHHHHQTGMGMGGLQPTSLSKNAWGPIGIGTKNSIEESRIRRQLTATNRRLDILIEKTHSKAIKEARLARRIIQRKEKDNPNYNHNHHLQDDQLQDIPPEYDAIAQQQLLQEDTDRADRAAQAHQAYSLLQNQKWSLDRAILLYGQQHTDERLTERQNLLARLDKPLLKAASDLYKAYKLLQTASQKLELPQRVFTDSVDAIRKYASHKEGFRVKGVASRLSSAQQQKYDKATIAKIKDFNYTKQIASVGAALLFLMARKHNATRSIQQVCNSFPHPHRKSTTTTATANDFIKSKHCTKAMNELRILFPDMMISLGTLTGHSGNYVEHTLRKLSLPPVASASIQTLVDSIQKEETAGTGGGVDKTKLPTLCASVAFFVCMAGEFMQRLAQQSGALAYNDHSSKNNNNKKQNGSSAITTTTKSKKRKREDDNSIKPARLKLSHVNNDDNSDDDDDSNDDSDNDDEQKEQIPKGQFDIFTHKAIPANKNICNKNSEYEMRRMWDAWSEQVSWSRSSSSIEQACGVSRGLLLDFYKNKLFPQRDRLLGLLRDQSINGSLRDTPRAASLLSHIGTAAALMNVKGKI